MSPITPDFTYKLDLSLADHRRVAYLLTVLDRQEPGDSWSRARYDTMQTPRPHHSRCDPLATASSPLIDVCGCRNAVAAPTWLRRRFKRKPLPRAPEEWAVTVPVAGKLSLTFNSYAPGVSPDWGFRLKLCEFVLAEKTDAILL